MRSILLSLIFALPLLLTACGSSETGDADATAEPAAAETVVTASGEELPLGDCCGGACGTPEGYCCNESHCGGKCDASLPIWDTVAKAPKKLD